MSATQALEASRGDPVLFLLLDCVGSVLAGTAGEFASVEPLCCTDLVSEGTTGGTVLVESCYMCPVPARTAGEFASVDANIWELELLDVLK